jgi:hypothetical protein
MDNFRQWLERIVTSSAPEVSQVSEASEAIFEQDEIVYINVNGYELPKPLSLSTTVSKRTYPNIIAREEVELNFKVIHRISVLSDCCWIIPGLLAFGQYPFNEQLIENWKMNDFSELHYDCYMPVTDMDKTCHFLANNFDCIINTTDCRELEHTELYPYEDILHKFRFNRRGIKVSDEYNIQQFSKSSDNDLQELTDHIVQIIREKHSRVLVHEGYRNNGDAALIAGIVFAKLYGMTNVREVWFQLQAVSTTLANIKLCLNEHQYNQMERLIS